jgi:hypothetical protein
MGKIQTAFALKGMVKVKSKLVKHYAMKTYRGMEV